MPSIIVEVGPVELTPNPGNIVPAPLIAVMGDRGVWDVLKPQPGFPGPFGPVQVFVVEVVSLVETSDSSEGAGPNHGKACSRKRGAVRFVFRHWPQRYNSRPRELGGTVRVIKPSATSIHLGVVAKKLYHAFQGPYVDVHIAVGQQHQIGIGK